MQHNVEPRHIRRHVWACLGVHNQSERTGAHLGHADCHTIMTPLAGPHSSTGLSADPRLATSSCSYRPWANMLSLGILLTASMHSLRPFYLPVLLGIAVVGMHTETPPDRTGRPVCAGTAEVPSTLLLAQPPGRPRVQSLCVPSPAFLSMTDFVACLSDAASVDTVVRIWRPCCGPAAIGLSHALTETDVLEWLTAQGCRTDHDGFMLGSDSLQDPLDFVCVPPASGCWWIVRESGRREYLRPVALSQAGIPATVQPNGSACSLVADFRPPSTNAMPVGARARVGASIPDLFGLLTSTGLVWVSGTTRPQLLFLWVGAALSLGAVAQPTRPLGFGLSVSLPL